MLRAMSGRVKKRSEYLTPTMFDVRLLSFAYTIFITVVDPFKILRKYFFWPVTESMMDKYQGYKIKMLETLDGSQSLILRLIVIFTIAFLLLCGAVLLYVLFYLMYMPSSLQVKPVHMQFNQICEDKPCPDLASIASPLHTFPNAHLQLNRNQLMMVGQPYHIHVRLDVPETPRNRDLGVFMICVDMKDRENLLKSHACRSTMLRYQSPWLQKLKTLVFIPFYVAGVREEKQDLYVKMFSKYIDTTNSVTDIYVEIQSKVVEFYAVSVHITAHFTGLRFIIFNFPVISACVGIGVNFIILAVITLMLWYHYDYEMEWIDDAKRLYTGKPKPHSNRKSSSSISTTDENLSRYDTDKIQDDDFMFDSDDGGSTRKTNPEE